MSAANAAARKRRAATDAAPQVVNRPNQFGSQNPTNNLSAPTGSPQPPQQGFTLQQVISVIDTRLMKLEDHMKRTEEEKNTAPSSSLGRENTKDLQITNQEILFQEFDKRFEILAEEISNLKDMLLKLQTYTMDVNKTLMEERVRVFSDLGDSQNEMLFQSSNLLLSGETASFDLRDLAESEMNQ